MDQTLYILVHVFCVLMLVGGTFQAIAAPSAENRARLVRNTGIFGLLLFVAGFGAFAKGEYESFGWLGVKAVCAIALTMLAPLAFKRPERTGRLTPVLLVVLALALFMVYYKPF